MNFSIHFHIQILFLVVFQFGNINCQFNGISVRKLQKNADETDHLVLIYDHYGNETNAYMKTNQAYFTRSEGGLFKFITGPEEDRDTYYIAQANSTNYLFISNSQLSYPGTEATKSLFRLVADPINPFKFNLNVDNDSLVTTDPAQPFRFFLKSRYPEEPPAYFFLTQLSVEDSYQGNRANILPTLRKISTGDMGNREGRYSELINLMTSYGHLNGSEIFAVAGYIKDDVGVAGVFKTLPEQVQLTVSGVPLSFYYVSGASEYRMKYENASNEFLNIQPYTFNYHKYVERFAITYGTSNQLHYKGTAASGSLTESLQEALRYEFQLRYFEPQEQVYIYVPALGARYNLFAQSYTTYYNFPIRSETGSSARFVVKGYLPTD